MGILVDFQEAKNRLTAPVQSNAALEDALEAFTFSQVPRQQRIALVLAGIFGGEAEDHLAHAVELDVYASGNFMKPYVSAEGDYGKQ